MDYRDERDALRGRVDVLEEDLAAARAKLADGTQEARIAQLLGDLERTQQDLARMRAEVQAMQQPRASRVVVLVAVAGAVCVLGGAGVLLALRAPPPSPAPVSHPIAVPNVPDPPARAPAHAKEAKPGPSREVTSIWRGRAQHVTGLPIAAGAPCTIHGTFTTDGATASARSLEIACGGKTLYRSTDALEGMSSHGMSIEEVPGDTNGTFRHALEYQDQGTRSGARTQASINTRERVAAAWKETMPAFRVELELDELSGSGADPIVEANRDREAAFRKPVERAGRITAITGAPPVPLGAACTVAVRPVFDTEHDCRVRVRCGAMDLYGSAGGGFNKCGVAGGDPVSTKDPRFTFEDGDPSLDLDLAAGRVIVSEREKGADGVLWSATIGVDPAKR